MRRRFSSLLALALAAAPAAAGPVLKTRPGPKPLDEVWEAAYVRSDAGVDVKIGYIHLTSVPLDRDGEHMIRTTKELRLTVGRADAKAEMKADVSADEDAAGKVQAVRAKLWLGKDRVQVLDCAVLDTGKIRVTADGEFKYKREFTWDPTCIGLAGEQTFLKDKKAKPGDSFTYRYFEPQVTNYVTVRVAVKDKETVALPGGVKRELLKVIATPDPLMVNGTQKLQLPSATFWADPTSLDTIRTEMDIPEIGKVSLLRTSKVAALAPNGQVPDLMKRQSIFLSAAIPGMHERSAAVYRVTFQGEAQPKDLVATDRRQEIRSVNGKTFDLVVTARRRPERIEADEKAGPEYLKSNYFLNSDDPTVRKLAREAVASGGSTWEKAQKMEKFVRAFMRPTDYTEAMAPADHVAKTRTGDCTEHAMLLAAMCKAEGIPARTAIGLVYVDRLLGKPAGLAFHMWTEVFVNNQWLALDATLGEGSVGPGHIKITDHSWDGVISFTPLLPVKGFIMANPTVEVVK